MKPYVQLPAIRAYCGCRLCTTALERGNHLLAQLGMKKGVE